MMNKTIPLLLLLTTALLLLGQTFTHAQNRIDPRHPSFAYMQEWGTMDGTTLQCLPGWVGETGELFGRQIIPTGDLNNDGMADYIIERSRCDSAFGANKTNRGYELLLFYGKKNSLPTPADGIRIGPSEIGSTTYFLCAGDFDDDGILDIACGIHLYGDTTERGGEYDIGIPVVFWGQPNGIYSTNDTTQLPCDAPIWITPKQGVSGDFNGDHIDDLFIRGSGWGFADGALARIPKGHIFAGERGKRWGRDGRDHSPVQRWWYPPGNKAVEYRDHDCSGDNDLIFYGGIIDDIDQIMVAYQHGNGQWIDTSDIEAINLKTSYSSYARLMDVTGDHLLDIVTIGGNFESERIKVFAGKAGQRLKEQYGTGTDSADRANGRFPLRPWVKMPTPTVLHDGWTGSEHVLFDLGDINGDGRSEIAAHSTPFILIYTTGPTLDSLIDVMARVPGGYDYNWGTIKRLGDIDGSGKPTFAVRYEGNVHFLKAPPKDEIPTYGGRIRSLPHPIDFRCALSSSVGTQGGGEQGTAEMDLSATSSDSYRANKTALAPHFIHRSQP
ncbi:MAG: hypothetical protein K1X90_05860 [Candidatus Kapabacteria bacterium]|nr:hypothetical protein [Candidatus Kapabacteria bacterium]